MRVRAVAAIFTATGVGLFLSALTPSGLSSAWAAPRPTVPVLVRAAPVLGPPADAINNLGLTKFQDLYAGDVSNSDGSVTLYLAPGSTTAFESAVSSLLASPAMRTLGARPLVTTVRVPESIAALDQSSRMMRSNLSQLTASGFHIAYWEPDPLRGTLDVYLSAVPHHITAATATAMLQRKVSPLVSVRATTAPVERLFNNRQQDAVPFSASDLIVTSNGQDACSAGFTVIGYAGFPRVMTDGHCGDTTFTNGGYTINSSYQLVSDGQPKQTFGTTSNYHYGSGYDVQLLENPDEYGFAPDVWVGTGTNQPTQMAVGGNLINYPSVGSALTTDGAFNRTVRYVPVQAAGSSVCANFTGPGMVCDLIQLAGTSEQGVTPTARPGDSGGPVFCYACSSNEVTPAGLVEGGTTSPGSPVFATFIGTDLSKLDATMATSGRTGSNAIEDPGSGALNAGGLAQIESVSCGSAGNCNVGGYYSDGSGHRQALVASETNATWGNAAEAPGTASLNTGGSAQINSESCSSAGNCSAGGYYTDSSSSKQAFVIGQVNGTWGPAQEVAASLNVSGNAQILSVSCASAGNCSAGGDYQNDSISDYTQAFVISEVNGTWGPPIEVPGLAPPINKGGAQVNSVSCASPGNCSAAGYYTDAYSLSGTQAFVVSEVNGTWGTYQEVAANLNVSDGAQILSVSCASAGNCSAGGYYSDYSGVQGFVVSEVSGTWDSAVEVPTSGALNVGGNARVTSVSCASAGNCSAGGSYNDGSGNIQAFVVSETNGTWGNAIEVPGSGALNAGGTAQITSISCGSVGSCSAGGWYTDSSYHDQALIASEVNGAWGNAIEVPGSAALNAGGAAQITSISCPVAYCTAAGWYTDSSGNQQAFVVSEG